MSQTPPTLIRFVLRAFPAAFRGRYAYEIWQCIRDGRDDLGDGGLTSRMSFWSGVVADLARGAAIEWGRTISREYALVLRRTAGIALIAAALANIGYDAMSVKLSMGLFVALLTSIGAIAGALLIRSSTTRSR